mmetsp:Transcript_16867/g.24408  ORF Transcript_16867/g.24408 Transcript_16867/m.24408 type:complete len:188 (-) Transcript_16867:172-735(-)|eukprot:CAMPEP_0202443280 /NCGR_PEP_ID=MMETSP1360-20130828/2609_1 /ASSEMBLY_ACC=CAM_ASM_000848 /TAXON_ID=515479 /ORGANISM="Licmophora paradoxa, Strain CCMP2313" /LENGTH=187 /DNA_ID=CAMNT_0049058939 /DNA_START=66 /DNA_END=629 /DNA_ORIENTATION=-
MSKSGLECLALAATQVETSPKRVPPLLMLPSPKRFKPGTPRVVSEEVISEDANVEELLRERYHENVPDPPSPDEKITKIQINDVLSGRGGETNHFSGNVQYRSLVKQYQLVYLKAKRRDKPRIARLIVNIVRHRNGRFLKKDMTSNTWKDIGNTKAREKVSQALREGAPELSKKMMLVPTLPEKIKS